MILIFVILLNIRIFNGGILFFVEFIKVRIVCYLVFLRSRWYLDLNKWRVDGIRWINWYKMMMLL